MLLIINTIPLALNAARRHIINLLDTDESLFTGNVAQVITDLC